MSEGKTLRKEEKARRQVLSSRCSIVTLEAAVQVPEDPEGTAVYGRKAKVEGVSVYKVEGGGGTCRTLIQKR